MKYYLIGIKGSGMSALASILSDLGNTVVGYDDSLEYKAITNVGSNPTINKETGSKKDTEIIVETHILDYSGDLYGKDIKLDFIRFLRTEMKFDNIEELKKQLEKDKERVNNKI